MAYDYNRLFRVIMDAVQADGSIADRMAAVLNDCEVQVPHLDWAEFKALDYSSDAQAMSGWLDLALSGPSIDDEFQGLWFGLHNIVCDDIETADVYVGAARSFDSRSNDWAMSPAFNPDHGELESRVLDSIYQLAYRSADGLGNHAEYPLALAYGSMVSCEVLERFALRPGFSGLRGAAAGFDSGDYLNLGEFADGHFRKHISAG
jgi:hypothetical protein